MSAAADGLSATGSVFFLFFFFVPFFFFLFFFLGTYPRIATDAGRIAHGPDSAAARNILYA